MNRDDSLAIEKLSVKDSGFVRYLDKIWRYVMLLTRKMLENSRQNLIDTNLVSEKARRFIYTSI